MVWMKCLRVTKCMYGGGLRGIRHVLNRQTPNCVPFIQFVFTKKTHRIPCHTMPDGDKVPHVQQADPSVSILCHSNSSEVSLHWKQAGDSRLILNKRTKKLKQAPSPPSRLRLLFFIHSTTYLEFLLLQLLETLATLDSCKKFHSY